MPITDHTEGVATLVDQTLARLNAAGIWTARATTTGDLDSTLDRQSAVPQPLALVRYQHGKPASEGRRVHRLEIVVLATAPVTASTAFLDTHVDALIAQLDGFRYGDALWRYREDNVDERSGQLVCRLAFEIDDF